jgi:hypothetical protein
VEGGGSEARERRREASRRGPVTSVGPVYNTNTKLARPPICFILPSLSHRVPSSCMCQAGNVGLLDAVLGVDAN